MEMNIIEDASSLRCGCLVHYYCLWCISIHRGYTSNFTEGKWFSQGLFTCREGAQAVHQPNRNLRSASRGLSLVVPPHQTQAYGARSFSVAAPTLWNSLPVDITNARSLFIFKKKLKTFLFNQLHS